MRSTEKNTAPNIQSMLTDDEKTLRSYLLDTLIKTNGPVHLDAISMECKNASIDVAANLKSLSEKGLIHSGDNNAILGVYPVSALPTRHRIKRQDGQAFFAMCAIASLGTAYEFSQDTTVSSSCSYCGKDIL